VTLNLDPGHKQLGALFNRFGIITTHIDGNGQTVYFDDITYTIDVIPEPSTAMLAALVAFVALPRFRNPVGRENWR
jgi:hypothetical protein